MVSSEVPSMSIQSEPLHFLVVPLLAPGHMIPMIDLARLLAARGVLITFITTPFNLARIRPVVDRAAASSLSIRFVELRFPVAEAGLPDGCESADLVPSIDLLFSFIKALSLLRDPLEAYLQTPDPDRWPEPDCLISDNLQHWTADVARSLNIPRLIFHGPSCFFLLCSLLIDRHRPELEALLKVASGGSVVLPGVPHSIRVKKQEVKPAELVEPGWSKSLEEIIKVEEGFADGVLVNSFGELEPWYLERYREVIGKPVWNVGPLSLYEEEADAKAARGQVSSVDSKRLVGWLDGKEAGSIMVVSFGSTVRNTMAQVVELGSGLESTGKPFIWVVKEVELPGLEEWVSEFEKRVEGRGLVIRGWAPQALILGHVAIGGFMTHCGWNSILEAVTEGIVLATWPFFWDQFLNQSFVVDVLKIGVAVGAEDRSKLGAEDGKDVGLKTRREVEKAVVMLMDGGEEGEKRRERAKELSVMARKAMEEGGSSWDGLKNVISYMETNKKQQSQVKTDVLRRKI